MNALECIERIASTNLIYGNLKYCFVTSNKLPVRYDGVLAKPNRMEDFVDLDILLENDLMLYTGIGISIQASDICAIDVDKCFSIPNDINSISYIGQEILEMFKDVAYCEFSFSGTGLRILFRTTIIDDYTTKYYIKNSNKGVEYYQPSSSYRYVTITGNVIYNNYINYTDTDLSAKLYLFLEKFMKKPELIKSSVNVIDTSDNYEQLLKKVKYKYLTDSEFQDLWFSKAPGSGKDESERDFHILAYLYENITQNKEMIKQLFESSSYFKSKDSKHINKWEYQENRYYNYIYEQIRRRKI